MNRIVNAFFRKAILLFIFLLLVLNGVGLFIMYKVLGTSANSGTAGSAANGAENTKAIAAGFVLISMAVASSILIQVGKPPTRTQTVEYSGLSLGYYSNRFKPSEIVAAVPSQAESSPSIQPENSASEAPQIRAQS
ncbi:protein MAINTENANCE OF PSII UNDER HIGH LIGHT 1-like [Manihot esculenta]|uniref:protein MAINTENANCE OF PSII UNDER HIGH LIGHT 1-like n=1 Tax=Manihot esculenta TaxID=3983 RepID=UPI000B5D3ADD|nr:protein MAINTENANCE OF PSII UNDER HIGH LIGHT 1-like [Manihot esculenta]